MKLSSNNLSECFYLTNSTYRKKSITAKTTELLKLSGERPMKLKKIAKQVGALGIACGLTIASFSAAAADTIKVGVLHSLSGTMAISETTLKDTMLMLIEEQNK